MKSRSFGPLAAKKTGSTVLGMFHERIQNYNGVEGIEYDPLTLTFHIGEFRYGSFEDAEQHLFILVREYNMNPLKFVCKETVQSLKSRVLQIHAIRTEQMRRQMMKDAPLSSSKFPDANPGESKFQTHLRGGFHHPEYSERNVHPWIEENPGVFTVRCFHLSHYSIFTLHFDGTITEKRVY
jgi:hypothetical protein